MTIRPLHDRVALKRKDPESTTKNGLYLPPNAQEKSNFCEVVAVGAGRITDAGVLIPPQVKVGDTVLIGKWTGDTVQLSEVEHLIVRESEILSVVATA